MHRFGSTPVKQGAAQGNGRGQSNALDQAGALCTERVSPVAETSLSLQDSDSVIEQLGGMTMEATVIALETIGFRLGPKADLMFAMGQAACPPSTPFGLNRVVPQAGRLASNLVQNVYNMWSNDLVTFVVYGYAAANDPSILFRDPSSGQSPLGLGSSEFALSLPGSPKKGDVVVDGIQESAWRNPDLNIESTLPRSEARETVMEPNRNDGSFDTERAQRDLQSAPRGDWNMSENTRNTA